MLSGEGDLSEVGIEASMVARYSGVEVSGCVRKYGTNQLGLQQSSVENPNKAQLRGKNGGEVGLYRFHNWCLLVLSTRH